MRNFSIFMFLSILTLSCELDGDAALITDLMGNHEVVVAGAEAGNVDEVFALDGGDEEAEIYETDQNLAEGVDDNIDQNSGNVDGHIVLVDAQGAGIPAIVEHPTVEQNVESREITKVERLEKYLESAINSSDKLNDQQRRLKNGKQMLFTWLNEDVNASKKAELEQNMHKLYGLIKESITDSSSQPNSQDGECSDEAIDGLLNSLFSSSFDNNFALDLFFQALLNTLYDFGRNNYRLADGIFADIRKVFSDESDTKGHFGYLKSKLKDELVILDEGDYEED
ncbi:hypothetical protein [Borrelia miyamotoi]|uniref:hypothetical protein n=1 Tax=Borrelia miyamotoi TaxID=47466 RepID=UPI00126547D1|nr:hypothetical protein [Borrelia miyamotoi]QFP48462.1 hypothetical protein F9Y91_04310 [Borrelia miyamotoi]